MALATAVLALAGCGFGGDDQGAGWPATKVALAAVQSVTAPRALQGVGELEAARQVQLASETTGRVLRVAFTSGQRVKQGDLLVQINDAPEQAERLRLRAQLRNAEQVLVRTRQLRADDAATQEQLDNAQAARDMARGQLQQIEAVIAQKAIRAPFPGVIGIRRVHEGQYLGPGDPIASLVDAARLHVNFSLDESAVLQLQPGQPVQLQVDAWPTRQFEATLTAIDPLISRARQVQVQASLPNQDGTLQAGMFASIRVLPPQSEPVLAVPETAVAYTAYGETVFVAESSPQGGLSVRRLSVEVGERWDGLVEILSGLQAGDQVVVSGQLKLSDGMAVEPLQHDALQAEHAAPPEQPS